MYSSRRSYSRYHKRKNAIQKVFNPTLTRAPVPNYFQQKGRTLQQSPARMHNSPTEMLSKQDLDKMYKTLVKFKYRFPGGGILDLPPFMITLEGTYAYAFPDTTNNTLTPPYFNNVCEIWMRNQMPLLVENYNFQYALYAIQFQYAANTLANCQFHIDWITNLLQNPYSLVLKTVDAPTAAYDQKSILTTANFAGYVNGQVDVRIIRNSFSAGGTLLTSSPVTPTLDTNPDDNGNYPFIDTSLLPNEIGYGAIQLVLNSGEFDVSPNFYLFIQVTPSRKN